MSPPVKRNARRNTDLILQEMGSHHGLLNWELRVSVELLLDFLATVTKWKVVLQWVRWRGDALQG